MEQYDINGDKVEVDENDYYKTLTHQRGGKEYSMLVEKKKFHRMILLIIIIILITKFVF